MSQPTPMGSFALEDPASASLALESLELEHPELESPDQSRAAEVVFPPGDLWSDEPNLESDFHRDQIELLIRILKSWWRDRSDFYVTGNLTVYYSPNQKKSEHFRGPDFLVVLGTEKKDRRSWVVWQEEGKYPNIIIEILSDSTAAVDKGFKKQLYQDTWRVPDYFWFDPYTFDLTGFHLTDGEYQPLQPSAEGRLWSQQLQLYLGVKGTKLRFFTPDHQLIPSPEEQAEAEHLRAEQERLRAEQAEQLLDQERQRVEQERQRTEQMAAYLRSQGIDPDNLPL